MRLLPQNLDIPTTYLDLVVRWGRYYLFIPLISVVLFYLITANQTRQ